MVISLGLFLLNRVATLIRGRAHVALAILIATPNLAAGAVPVGLISFSDSARLLRAGTSLNLEAKNGDALFPGDQVIAVGKALAIVAFCPTKRSYSVTAGSVEIGPSGVRATQGRIQAEKALPFCELPAVESGSMSNIRFYVEQLRQSLMPPQTGVQAQLSSEQQKQLDGVNAVIRSNPDDIPARTARALMLERFGRPSEAIAEYEELGRRADVAVWTHAAALQVSAGKSGSRAVGGTTYAVIIGIDRYPLLSVTDQLHYAQLDANAFSKYLTGKGGDVPAKNVTLLLGQKATLAAVQDAITSTFARATANDVVAVYVAAHGIAPPKDDGISDAYLLTYDSDPQNLGSTAYRMSELQALMSSGSVAREVRIFIDACHSGRIGSIQSARLDKTIAPKLKNQSYSSQVFALLASRATEKSYECDNLKHGAFTYFVLRGLETDEAADPSGKVTADGLVHYVSNGVRIATSRRQNPIPNAGLPPALVLRRDSESVGDLSLDTKASSVCEGVRGRTVGPPDGGPEADLPSESSPNDAFDAALRAGRLLPSQPNNAFTILAALKGQSNSEYRLMADRLRIELENAGQLVLLQYLKGESIPPQRNWFQEGAEYFLAAHQLAPGDNQLLSKQLFCEARVLIFDGKNDEAIRLLEIGVRIDPTASYAYNAIGLAYLQKADYQRAEAAFRDTIRLAPYWIYPRHNLALTLSERGEFQPAVREYNDALALKPTYAYVAYNLGVTLQKGNKAKAARSAFNQALEIDPNMARAHTGLGLSYALDGETTKAANEYNFALRVLYAVPNLDDELAARHNLALLLTSKKPDEAICLWKLNLARSGDQDLPSLIGLARTFQAAGRTTEEIQAYRRIVELQPKYAGARLVLAARLVATGDFQGAREQLEIMKGLTPGNPLIYELSGDTRKQQPEASREDYENLFACR